MINELVTYLSGEQVFHGFAMACVTFLASGFALRKGWLGSFGSSAYQRWKNFVIAEDRNSDERITYLETSYASLKENYANLHEELMLLKAQLAAVERDRDSLRAYVLWQAENPPPPYISYRAFVEHYYKSYLESVHQR